MSAEIRLTLPKLHPGQRQVKSEARRFNVLQCGRRWGKTTLGVDLLLEPALNGFPAAWFAPTYKLLAEVWRNAVTTAAAVTRQKSEQEKRIELITGGVLEFWSLDGPDPARGRKYKRIIGDEGGIVRNLQAAWQEAIRPTLTDYAGDGWFLGTPKGRGYFHQLYTKGESGAEAEWKSWRRPTVDNPYIDPAEVEAARRDLPPAAFNQEFLGIPADDGGNPFDLRSIEDCILADGLARGPAIVYGCDLAKSYDFTVLCGLNDAGHVCHLERWQSDWGQTIQRVVATVGRTPTLVDSTGAGDSPVEQMQRGTFDANGVGNFPAVYGFKFTSGSKQQLMEGLSVAIQRGEIGYPAGWLVTELESFEYEYTARGVKYTAPPGLHDDGVMALALAWRKLQEMRGAGVSIVGGGRPIIVSAN